MKVARSGCRMATLHSWRSSATPKGRLSHPARLGCPVLCGIHHGRRTARRWCTRSRSTPKRRKCFRLSAAIPNFRYIARAIFAVVAGGRPFRGVDRTGAPDVRHKARMAARFTTAKARRWRSRAGRQTRRRSPSGSAHILAATASKAVIAMVIADGTEISKVTEGPGNASFPSWSPDRKDRLSSGGTGAGLTDSKSGRRQSVGGSLFYGCFPAWSPKGDLIEFTSFTRRQF